MKNRFAAIVVIVMLLSSLMGKLLGDSLVAARGIERTARREFIQDFTEALDLIQNNYADNVQPDALVYGAIKGMLKALDPHSNFLDPDAFSKLRDDQHSIYCGLGIHIRPLSVDRGRHVIVEHPIPGTPAHRKGLRLGDVITQIEGEPIDNLKTDDVISRLKGLRGTSVTISVERPNVPTPLQFTIEREEIPVTTVPYAFEIRPGIGYFKIDRFSETTAKELGSKLDALNGLTGIILDLRDNPGGLLNQAIEVTDFFLNPGSLIVSTRGRLPESAKRYKAPGREKSKVPLVILINHNSASASEIVAGALQDHDRALIVGETSFGKGLVQTVYPLAHNTGLTLTTAKYYTPSGRLIQRDYSGSNLEYFYMDSEDSLRNKKGSRELKYTDAKRKVYGGGGITPDIVEAARELNRFETTLVSKDVFFQYGRRITLGNAPARPEMSLEIDDAVIADFKKYLRERNIDFAEGDISTNIDFIKRRIKQNTFISSFGIKEGFKVAIQSDLQVVKALAVMSQAKLLMSLGHPVVPQHFQN